MIIAYEFEVLSIIHDLISLKIGKLSLSLCSVLKYNFYK